MVAAPAAAKQHREEIQELGAQQHRLGHQETNSDRQILSDASLVRHHVVTRVGYLREQDERDSANGCFDDVGQLGAGETVDDSPDGWPEDCGELPER